MKYSLTLIFAHLLYISLYSQIKYPHTPTIDQEDNYHGTIVKDPFRWLENDTADATRAWVKEQSKITSAYLEGIPFRNGLRNRIAAYYNYTRYSSPLRNGEYYYYYKNDGLQDYSVLYRQKGLKAPSEIVIDPNKLSPDASIQVTHFVPSNNGRYAAWMISKSGSDWQTILVKDLVNLTDLKDSLKWVKESDIAWQGNGFYYSRYPRPAEGSELTSENRNQQLWYHEVGTPQSHDKLIFEDSSRPYRFYYASTSEDERYVYMSIVERNSKGLTGNALWYLDNESSNRKFVPIVEEPGEFIYGVVDPVENSLLIQTNEGAPNGKLILYDPAKPQKKYWRTIVPEKNEPLDIAVLAGGLVFAKYLKDVTSRIIVYRTNGRFVREIKLPGPGDAEIYRGMKDDSLFFYTFRSLNYPTHIFNYNIQTGQIGIFQKPELLFNPDDYVTTRRFFISRDGTRVPLFMVHKKNIPRRGNNPTIMYGYGGFNYAPGLPYDASIMPWLEQGGIYVIVGLRGGSEYGRQWHLAGMLHKKQRVFDDFIAAAEYLIRNRYTSPRYLGIHGASNGGLLVGAVVNQRPDLFSVAVPEVGVMDMLRFQKFTIGWNWIAEYGSSDNENDFRNLISYSPLHNIKDDQEYPAILAVTADHDDRVVPAHTFKYIATLQQKYKGRNPMLLKIQTNTGHGLSSIMKNIELTADIHAFMLFHMGEGRGQKADK